MRGTIQSWRRATVCGGLLIFFLYGRLWHGARGSALPAGPRE